MATDFEIKFLPWAVNSEYLNNFSLLLSTITTSPERHIPDRCDHHAISLPKSEENGE